MKLPSICLFSVVILSVQSAPIDAPSPKLVYDQKQTGEYNIQVHLKDLQIVALLGDDALGDYDYNYDYSDFTIKPPAGNVTLKPPPPPEETSTSPSPAPEKPATTTTTEKPAPASTTAKAETEKTTPAEDKVQLPFSTSSPDRIKVQIIEEPNPNLSIVPSDDVGAADAPALGEVVHYRRCATGYARDKKGRCRRVRRPGHGHQFDLGRLASTLAARFRGSTTDEAALGESNSKQ
ncbi:unnamed protein product [Tenebrio molitor]|jgi:hypothetical protein|nr:unnamed protein product [Tenebrio molitor]